MELKNKKIAFLGDSITEGAGVADMENIYWNRIAKATGAQSFGYGIGGTRIAVQREPSPDARFDRYFASRIPEMIPDADVIVIFGGVNDYGHGDAPFGSMTDRTEETFCGAYHMLLQKLIETYPEAQIVAMTPMHCLEEGNLINSFGYRRCRELGDYVDAIKEICAYYAVPVLDLYRVSGMQPKVAALRERYMPDGIHPNDAGHEKIAAKLLGFLKSL